MLCLWCALILETTLASVARVPVVGPSDYPTQTNLTSAPGSTESSELVHAWSDFKAQFAKTYATASEEDAHRAAFSVEMDRLAALSSPTQGLTAFSDVLSDEAFATRWLGRKDPAPRLEAVRRWDGTCYACVRFPHLGGRGAPPASFDWRDHGAVTAVKTQNCGDCYAFGTTGDVEGVWFLAGHPLVSLSEEAIVDCCFEDEGIMKCAGCAGGNQENVFDWIVQKGGIDSEATYPYVVPKRKPHPSNCRRDLLTNASFAAKIGGWYQVAKGAADEDKIAEALLKAGPITVGIDAITAKLKAYTGGVHAPEECKHWKKLNHAVLIVGYGTDGGVPYWTVKNSWGEEFGEDGYFRLKRGENLCGIAEDAVHSMPPNASSVPSSAKSSVPSSAKSTVEYFFGSA